MSETDANPYADAPLEKPNAAVIRPEHAEGEIARLIEQQSAKLPSHWFLFAALGAMGLSLGLEAAGRSRASRFVGMWPSTLLMAGIYNKMVKTLGTR